jgi:hypothetical protein
MATYTPRGKCGIIDSKPEPYNECGVENPRDVVGPPFFWSFEHVAKMDGAM